MLQVSASEDGAQVYTYIYFCFQVQGQGASAGSKPDGVVSVMKGLYKEGGIRSIFRGTGATLARDGPGSAA